MKGLILSFITLVFSVCGFSQQNPQEKIYGDWVTEKFELSRSVKDADKIQSQLKGVVLSFRENTVHISQPAGCMGSFLNSGPYRLKDNIITFGVDKAEIKFTSEMKFEIRIPNQGVLTCTRSNKVL